MPQAVDMEIKGWVVRSDVGTQPAWLKQIVEGANPLLDITHEETEAFVFTDFDHAEMAANVWSDFPGIWRAERV